MIIPSLQEGVEPAGKWRPPLFTLLLGSNPARRTLNPETHHHRHVTNRRYMLSTYCVLSTMLRHRHVFLHSAPTISPKVDIAIDSHFTGEKTEDAKVVQWVQLAQSIEGESQESQCGRRQNKKREHQLVLESENLASNPRTPSSKFHDLCQIMEPL